MANCQYGCEVLKGEVRCQCPSPGLQLAADGRTCVGESPLLFLRPPGLNDEQANGKTRTSAHGNNTDENGDGQRGGRERLRRAVQRVARGVESVSERRRTSSVT